MNWQEIAKESQAKVLDSIPKHWRLDVNQYRGLKDVADVPYTCGLLNEEQLKITELTATEIVEKVKTRELKAVQVLEAFAGRAAIAHQLVNCLTEWFYEAGLARARGLDEALEKGGQLKGLLHGVPIVLKDIHCVAGHASTMAFVSGRKNIVSQDSAVVAALRAEGAIFFCKTTMPQSAMAIETVSNLWGRTLNPFSRNLNAGGSSGGDGVLVAMKVVDFEPPFDCWQALRTTFDIYYQGGADAAVAALEESGEPMIPAFADLLKVFNVRKLPASEIIQLSGKVRDYKEQFLAAWKQTAIEGHPIDALICPPAPGVGYPHDFNTYWGYTSLFNLIDYPAAVLPIPGLKVNAEQDPLDSEYVPMDTNPYDKPNHEIYDPNLFENQAICIQVVGRPFEDEELIQVSATLDALFRGL
nr:hypothetical protein FVER53263_12272 [Fusarium verticillioides]